MKFRQYTGNGHIIVDASLKMTRFPGGYFTPDGEVYLFGCSDLMRTISRRGDGCIGVRNFAEWEKLVNFAR